MKKFLSTTLLVLLCFTLMTTVALADNLTPEEARQVHYDALVVDTHNDSMGRTLDSTSWQPVKDPRYVTDGDHLDVVKIAEGGIDVAFFGSFMAGYV